MEDDFELISKSELNALKEENEKLKTGSSSVEGLNKLNPKLVEDLSALFVQEAKKERLFILKNLEEIKELNKQTLNNVLSRTETMEYKIEDLVETLSKLVETFSDAIKGKPSNPNENTNSAIGEIKDSVSYLDTNVRGITNKILEIEDFMHKLKTLLGQIKPNNMTLSSQQNSPPTSPAQTPPSVSNANNSPPPFNK